MTDDFPKLNPVEEIGLESSRELNISDCDCGPGLLLSVFTRLSKYFQSVARPGLRVQVGRTGSVSYQPGLSSNRNVAQKQKLQPQARTWTVIRASNIVNSQTSRDSHQVFSSLCRVIELPRFSILQFLLNSVGNCKRQNIFIKTFSQ